MLVPDQSHINRVRDALWQRFGGGASVMIGSGFSRSALKIRPDAQDPPLWRDVVEKMSDKLYPSKAGGAPATDGHLRIAQEYETAFGRSALHRFIQQTVRDDDFKPGEVHTRLLRLPWRDVFTTNWDTLLERVRISVPERAYSVVTNMDEIPLASRPRIVKLHGSLPAQFPLIFTEEDYRTYPTKFAPFVNTVQQAMMETVMLLIGFSGDDPNFLQWSGWVRDNLGDAAPKIYLAGWLNLSPHRRRMLEDRNVVPVDLAHHPKAGTWPEHLRHHYATEWLLHTLERGRPGDVTKWPSRSDKRWLPVPEEIQPVEEPTSNEPMDEPRPSPPEHGSERLTTSVRETLKAWEHNRNIYPGWLAVPANSRFFMNWNTEVWERRILGAIPEFSPVERLGAIHELVWRREIMLEPISPPLETSAEEILTQINCQARTINDESDMEVDWNSIREMWRTVALALVTVARYRFEQEVFDKRIEALLPFHQDHPDVAQRIHHERCLWAAWSVDFQSLESLLRDWHTEGCDPVWMLRKAALLVEVNRVEEAVQLLNHTLLNLRENLGDGRSVAGPSREGWALCLVAAFKWRPGQDQVKTPQSFSEWDERRLELASLKCDAFAELKRYEEAVTGKTGRSKKQSFDLGVRQSDGFTYSNDEYNRWLAAHRAIRLYEVAGLATAEPHLLKLAAEKLSTSRPELAARLVLRISTYDEDTTLTHVFSRTRVAAMPTDFAKTLAQVCDSVVEYALPRIASEPFRPIAWVERLRVALEILSRLVLRLEPDTIQDVFNRALAYYRTEAMAQHHFLSGSIRNLLKRTWEALPEAQRTARVVDLLSAPIVGLDLRIPNPHTGLRYPDPGEFLLDENCSPPTRAADNEGRWQEIVSLLVRGLDAGGEARERAIGRVATIALLKQEPLTEAERSRIAEALWHETYTDAGKRLPSRAALHRRLHDWVFLLMPQPEPGIAERCLRAEWLVPDGATQEDAPKSDVILWHVGTAISSLKRYQRPLNLSEAEQSYLIEVVKEWSNTPVPTHFDPYAESQIRVPTHLALSGLPSILAEVQIPEAIGEKLYEKVQDLNNSEIPAFELIAGLVRAMPNRLDEFALLMRTGLASDSEDLSKGAVQGLYHWLTTAAADGSQIQPPSDDLIREVGIIIATRRKASLVPSLSVAKWVFDEGSDAQKQAIRDLALHGLGYLAEELQYDRDHDPDNDVPLLRWCSAQLALSMAAHGSENAPAVVRWLEIAENDPLPEVRYAKRPAITREAR